MEQFLQQFMQYDVGVSWQGVLLSMIVSFILCQLIAAVYSWTYRGLSYSRGFVHSLVFGGLVATVLMLAIGNNIARGLGLMGTLALIRYRATLKDSRDMIFIFSSLAVGIAAGVQTYLVAVIGTVTFCLFVIHISRSTFGSRRQFDGLVRFQAPAVSESDTLCKEVLKQYCSNFVLVNLRTVMQGGRMEHAYQVKLLDPSYNEPLMVALRTVPGIGGVSVLMQDQAVEL